jgi:hypothetical protein
LICCVPRSVRKDGTFPCPEVYIAPLLLASSFAGDVPSLIARSDLVDHWCEWFTVLNSDTVQGAPHEVKLDLAKQAFKLEPTPAKRNRYTKLPFSPVEDDFEKITPMLESLPPDPGSTMALDLIVKNWPLLIENVNHLDKLMSSTRRNLADFQVSVEGDITTNELRAQSFLGTIGARLSANFGTSSIWGALSDLHQGMEHTSRSSTSESDDLRRELAAGKLKLDSLFSDPGFIRSLKQLTGADIKTAISPFQVVLKDFLSPFFWKYTSHQAAVDCGDKLEARLAALEAGMSSKPQAASEQSSGLFSFAPPGQGPPPPWPPTQGFAPPVPPAAAPPFGPAGHFPPTGAPPEPSVYWGRPWAAPSNGVSSMNINIGAPTGIGAPGLSASYAPWPPAAVLGPSLADFGALQGQLTALQAQISLTKAQMGTKQVDVGLLSFGSLREASAFLATHLAIKDYSLFVCPISLMAVSSHGLDSLMDELKFDDYSSKRGQDSTQAVFELSFRNELPQIFGQLPQSGVARNSRALLALPSYSNWDTGLGLNGTRHVLVHNLAHTRSGLVEMMKLLSPEPRQLALDMLSTSLCLVPFSDVTVDFQWLHRERQRYYYGQRLGHGCQARQAGVLGPSGRSSSGNASPFPRGPWKGQPPRRKFGYQTTRRVLFLGHFAGSLRGSVVAQD